MIIEEIEIKNFRAYMDSKIVLSKPGEKNVTLIYGENGAGKTTFFYAINWCFYGRRYKNFDIIPRSVRIDGKYLKNILGEGERTFVSVKIKFTHQKDRYTLERKYKIIKKNGDLEYGNEEVSLNSFNSIGQTRSYSEEEIPRIINSLIPVTTREYFFFDGEKIDRFSDVSNTREIESSIRAVLGLDSISYAKKYTHDASRTFDKLVSSNGNDEYTRTITLIGQHEDDINQSEEKLELLTREKNALIDELNEIKHKSKIYQQEIENRDKLEEIKKDIERSIENKKKKTIDLHDYLKRCYLACSITLHEESKKIMNKWSDDGIFPSEAYNEELVDKTLKECACIICGRKFNEFDDVYNHIKSLKEKDLFNREIERELNTFNSNIKDLITKGKYNFKNIIDEYKAINNISEQQNTLISKRDHLKDRIIDKITNDELREMVDKEHALETQTIPEINSNIKIVDIQKGRLLKELGQYKKHKEKLNLKSKSEQENKDKAEICERAENALELILDSYADEKRKEIDAMCRELFKLLVWKESHFQNVKLTKDYQLNVMDQFGETARPDLSAGERQVLSLSFITSMAKSANKEAPFIIDTPFGRISKKPRKYIAENIPSKVTQLILFVTDTELTDESEKIFMKRSEKIWTIEFNQKTSISTIREGKHVD
jgi:DNA sulfur modification protein DndD